MTSLLRVACAEFTATPDTAANMAAVTDFTRQAIADGAALVAFPENVGLMAGKKDMRAQAKAEADHLALAHFRGLAAETGTWLLAGSLAVALDEGRLANRSFLIDGAGNVVATYDKIHMFDVDLDGGESYRESESYRPGSSACIAPSPWGPIGLTVCYDLRFPSLYRALAQAGARLITIPSAFTVPTGAAHWHVLIRARAIETGCFVLAPAQTGTHYGRRQTYGHSLIVDPWGEVLAEGTTEPGVIVADLNLSKIDEARAMVPSLRHDRTYAPPPDRVADAAE